MTSQKEKPASEGGPYKIKNKNKEPSQEWLGYESDPRGRGKRRPYKRECGLGFDQAFGEEFFVA